MRLTKGASADTQKYMADGIRHICENYKRRSPGSHSERKAQKYLKSELEKWADKVEMEDFSVHPGAFMGWIPVAAVFGLLSGVFYWLTYTGAASGAGLAVVATVLVMLALACLVVEFLMYREFVDFLFPRKISRNVMARRAPKGEVKRRIIFGGHTDAANEWTYSLHGGLKSLAPVMGGSIGGLIAVCIFDVVWLIYALAGGSYESGFWLVCGIIQLIVDDLNKRLSDRDLHLELTPEARQFVVDNAYDPAYGARPLKRYIQKNVETLAAKLILQDAVDEGDTILIDVKNGGLTAAKQA